MSIRSTRQTNVSKMPGAIDIAGRNRMIVGGGVRGLGLCVAAKKKKRL